MTSTNSTEEPQQALIQKTECIVDATLTPVIVHGPTVAETLASLKTSWCAVVSHDLDESHTRHVLGFAGYLRACWERHLGVVLSPSMLMFVTLSQMAKHIKANADKYRALFTGQEQDGGRKTLLFANHTYESLTAEIILERLKTELAATSNVDVALFCPQFSDSSDKVREATAACFCEAMESYFEYQSYMCGLAKVRVVGTSDDWALAAKTCERLGAIFTGAEAQLNAQAWLYRHIWLSRSDPAQLKRLFRIDICSSAHDTMTGELVTLYNLTADIKRSADDLPVAPHDALTESARIEIQDNENDATFYKRYAVLASDLENGYLVPRMNCVVHREYVPLSAKRKAGDSVERQEAARKRFVPAYVSNCPMIRDFMAAGIHTIACKDDECMVNLMSGKTNAGGPNAQILQQLRERYTVKVSDDRASCTCTLKPEYAN